MPDVQKWPDNNNNNSIGFSAKGWYYNTYTYTQYIKAEIHDQINQNWDSNFSLWIGENKNNGIIPII